MKWPWIIWLTSTITQPQQTMMNGGTVCHRWSKLCLYWPYHINAIRHNEVTERKHFPSCWRFVRGIVLFHNSFYPGGEQPERRIFAYQSEQPTACCRVIFHEYPCYVKHGRIITNLPLWNFWGMFLICQSNTMRVYGAWIRTYFVLCSKTCGTFGGLYWFPAGSRQAAGAPAFVRLAYSPVTA